MKFSKTYTNFYMNYLIKLFNQAKMRCVLRKSLHNLETCIQGTYGPLSGIM